MRISAASIVGTLVLIGHLGHRTFQGDATGWGLRRFSTGWQPTTGWAAP